MAWKYHQILWKITNPFGKIYKLGSQGNCCRISARWHRPPAYIPLKDHKDNFRPAHPYRLINPCKSKIGKISKSTLQNINRNLLKVLQVNQWRNSESVIKWFYSIENKSQCKFIQLDIAEFYPSISEKILDNAILFAQQHSNIPEKDLIIKHCRKSLLYNNNETWRNKIQKAALTPPWRVLMVPKYASLSASIIIFIIK